MAFQAKITKATRTKCAASIQIEGLSGKGKSGTALLIALALADNNVDNLLAVDTEKKFQKGEIKHLICNTQAAQEGLTLDTAETEIFIEQFPPYGSIDQASKRFTPATPEKANIPKRIIKLILEKTYDEAINETINSREKNVNILNNFKKYLRR